jgi:hypothetical protein
VIGGVLKGGFQAAPIKGGDVGPSVLVFQLFGFINEVGDEHQVLYRI